MGRIIFLSFNDIAEYLITLINMACSSNQNFKVICSKYSIVIVYDGFDRSYDNLKRIGLIGHNYAIVSEVSNICTDLDEENHPRDIIINFDMPPSYYCNVTLWRIMREMPSYEKEGNLYIIFYSDFSSDRFRFAESTKSPTIYDNMRTPMTSVDNINFTVDGLGEFSAIELSEFYSFCRRDNPGYTMAGVGGFADSDSAKQNPAEDLNNPSKSIIGISGKKIYGITMHQPITYLYAMCYFEWLNALFGF